MRVGEEAARNARDEGIQLRRIRPDGAAPHLVARVLDEAPGRAVIRTTIDGRLQQRVEGLVARRMEGLRPLGVDHVALSAVMIS